MAACYSWQRRNSGVYLTVYNFHCLGAAGPCFHSLRFRSGGEFFFDCKLKSNDKTMILMMIIMPKKQIMVIYFKLVEKHFCRTVCLQLIMLVLVLGSDSLLALQMPQWRPHGAWISHYPAHVGNTTAALGHWHIWALLGSRPGSRAVALE